ncbi:MAG: DMT family transporter [Betaproteobacteria bacterium]|nr:DMT family transporter [Betaproteobacteria bacterium]
MSFIPVSSHALAYAALVCTTALWGSNGVVSRALMDTIPPLVMAAARWAVVFVVLLPLVWPERRAIAHSLRRDWKLLLALTLLGGAPQTALVYSGLAASTAIHLGLLNSTIPVFIILISWGWYARRPSRLEGAGLATSLIGVLLILVHGDLRSLLHLQFNNGDLLMLGAVVVWAIYTLRLKDRPQSLSLFAFVFALSLIGELLTLPFAAFQWVRAGVHLGTREWLGLLYIGAVVTLVSTVLFSYGVDRVGAVRAGILIHLMPVFSSAFAALFIGERLFLYHAAGFVLVAGGAILGCLRPEPVLSSQASSKT